MIYDYIKLVTGTSKAHEQQPFKLKAGNFSVVTDLPQLRFHDGVNPGGQVIEISEALHTLILAHYSKSKGQKVTANTK